MHNLDLSVVALNKYQDNFNPILKDVYFYFSYQSNCQMFPLFIRSQLCNEGKVIATI